MFSSECKACLVLGSGLSHNSRDEATVLSLKEKLVEYSLTVWFDQDQLRPGIPWQDLLEEGIRESRSVIVAVGVDGLGPWERAEMKAALHLAVRDRRPVIPVLLPDCPCEPDLLAVTKNCSRRPSMSTDML
jgi:hypothetical protein